MKNVNVAALSCKNGFSTSREFFVPSTADLFVALSEAETVESIGEAVRNYCNTAFGSPAVLIFFERDGELQVAWQWHSRQLSRKNLDEMMLKTPALRVFRTGKPVFCYRRKPSLRIAPNSLSLLSLGAPGQRPIGVLAIVFAQNKQIDSATNGHLEHLAQIVSGSIAHARAYEQAVQARVQAERTVKMHDDLISAFSHELKNPMTPILGWAVALSSGNLPPERQNLAVDIIVRNVRALNYLIEDMFDGARISSGKLRLRTSSVRMQEIAREAMTVIQRAAEDKKLRISTEISEAVPPFIADPQRLRQVLLNLLNNAVKFTPSGGRISLTILKRNNQVECIVSDSGRGIEPKFLPFVFDRFRQENRGPQPQNAGLGLGLTIVRQIVDLHGGTIKAYSRGVDKGATFILRLPLRRAHMNHGSMTRSASL